MPLFNARIPKAHPTTCTVGPNSYGAEPDPAGPLGGGAGYKKGVTPQNDPVETLDALIDALAAAEPGDTIFLDGSKTFECTERVYVDGLVLELPEGVTLASDRGLSGSPGALIRSDTFETRPLIRVTGPGARVTGLRLSGPNPRPAFEHHNRAFAEGRGHEYYYKFPIAVGIDTQFDDLQVDNCELAGWSHSAIRLGAGSGHRIHHSFIHHNRYNGLGYGVSHDTASSRIDHNLFNDNRHSIAGTGRPGCAYEACHNIELGRSVSHCFDMHGGRDREDGTDIAGSWMKVHHNTFLCPKVAVKIRGNPEEPIEIHRNWFCHPNPERAVVGQAGIHLTDNAFGIHTPTLT